MNQLRIELAGGRTAFMPGQPISGRVSWRLADQPSSAQLRLFWYTSGKGVTDVGVVEMLPFASPQREDQREFTLTLPREPYSFSGTLIALRWALELMLEPGGLVERLEFVLAPTGQPVVLGSPGT